MDQVRRDEIDKRKKIIALSSLPLCLVFFFYRMQVSTKAAPPAPVPSAIGMGNGNGKAQAVTVAVGNIVPKLASMIVVPETSKDPFAPAFSLMKNITAAPPSKAAPKPVAMLPHHPIAIPSLPVPSMPLQPFPATKPVVVSKPVVVKPHATKPAAPVMPYVLTGIVKGNPDVAILRHSDGSRRIARVGDSLDDTCRLLSIGETSVRIFGPMGPMTLRLGGIPEAGR